MVFHISDSKGGGTPELMSVHNASVIHSHVEIPYNNNNNNNKKDILYYYVSGGRDGSEKPGDEFRSLRASGCNDDEYYRNILHNTHNAKFRPAKAFDVS